ncbi:hypothetical protein [uncultured Methylobacterium sp.]|uniref:hypothetical protein n=1 Tax=uncultured Methylobacterium sp. TaxID=157278 RepID=UPI0035CB6201
MSTGSGARSMVERAGFRRGTGALLLDGLRVAVALQVAAVIAFPRSNGRIQATAGFEHVSCQRLTALPPGLSVPPEFDADFATTCLFSVSDRPTAVQRAA